MSSEIQRKLTTILAADAAGYSRRMEADEVGTLDELRASRAVFTRFIERHHGRIANTAGDGLIAEFPSVVEAVQCAIEVQRELADQTHSPKAPMQFRIGIHLGDVIDDGQDLLGEGVNLAARLQTMAEPGGVLISQQVYDQVHSKLSVGFDYLGEKRPKNYTEDVPVYRVSQGHHHGLFDHVRMAPPKPRAHAKSPPVEPSGDLQARVLRNARSAGIISAALLVIDLTTGAPFWMHWPALAFATFIALRAVPLFFGGVLARLMARVCVISLALVLINLFSWEGYFWAAWPAGAIVLGVALWWSAKGRHPG